MKENTYKITLKEYSDGTSKMTRVSKGFNALELLGVLLLAIDEIEAQIRGKIKPNIIERNVIKPTTKKE